jgi:hypothetical protein
MDERMEAEKNMQRTRMQAEMEKKRDHEMMVQHKVMISGSFNHKFAPVGDNPAGYVRPTPSVGQKQLQAAGGSSHISSGQTQKAGIQPVSGMRLRGLQGGAALEGSDDEDYSEGYDPNGVRAFVPDDGSVVDLKSANPPLLAPNVRMAGDDVGMLDMQDFNDDVSVGSVSGLQGKAKIVNTQRLPKFESNTGLEDDDTSVISMHSRDKPKITAPARGNKVAAEELHVLDIDASESMTKLSAGNENGKVKAKARLASGLLTNKFDDHEVESQRHTQTSSLASAYSITITGVSVLDVPSAHLMKKNSLQAICVCTGANAGVDPSGLALAATEPVEFISEVMSSCGESANWTSLSWVFPLIYGKRRQFISIKLSSGSKAISSWEIKADELYLASLQEKPGAIVRKFADMREGATFVGKIKLVYTTECLS